MLERIIGKLLSIIGSSLITGDSCKITVPLIVTSVSKCLCAVVLAMMVTIQASMEVILYIRKSGNIIPIIVTRLQLLYTVCDWISHNPASTHKIKLMILLGMDC